MLINLKKFTKAKEIYKAYLTVNPNDTEMQSLLQKAEGVLGKIIKKGYPLF